MSEGFADGFRFYEREGSIFGLLRGGALCGALRRAMERVPLHNATVVRVGPGGCGRAI